MLLNDFSALKSLKKELEKQDAPKNPAKPANEPRKKTVTHKSKEDPGLITFDPCHFGYIALGEKAGNAFSDGKKLK